MREGAARPTVALAGTGLLLRGRAGAGCRGFWFQFMQPWKGCWEGTPIILRVPKKDVDEGHWVIKKCLDRKEQVWVAAGEGPGVLETRPPI